MAISTVCCPSCLSAGQEVPLQTAMGKFGHFCQNSHSFDSADLAGMKLQSMSGTPQTLAPKPQPGLVQATIPISATALEKLKARFGDRFDSTAAAILTSMMDDGSFVISSEDGVRMSQMVAKPVKNAQALAGEFFAMQKELALAREKLDKIAAGIPAAVALGGGIRVTPSGAVMDTLLEKATNAGKTVEQYLGEQLDFWHSSGWMV